MGKKRIAINLIANTISFSTTVLIAFFLTPYLIRTLGKGTYSFYPLAINFINYISIITIALNSMASRFITIEIVKNNKIRANIYFVSVLYSNIIIAFVLLMIMSFIVIILEKIINIPIEMVISIKILFLLVLISMIVNIITSVFSVAVFAKNRLDLRSLVEVVQGIIRVALYIILFTLFNPTIVYVGIVTLVLSVCSFIFHFIFTKKLLPTMTFSKKYFDFLALKEILSSGIWNSINQLGTILLTSVSLLICNVYLGANATGDYAIVQTVPNFIIGVISMLTTVFMPTITQRYAEGDINLLVREVKYSQKVMGLFTNIPIMVFMVVGSEFFSLWIPNENAQRLQILSLMTIGHLMFTGVTWPISNLNTVMNKVKFPSLYLVGSGLANLGLVIFLLKTSNLGIYAIPLAALIINIVWSGVFIPIYPCKELQVKWNTFYPAVIKTLLGDGIILLTTIIVKSMVHIDTWKALLVVCTISGVIGFIVNSLIILKPHEIKEIANYIKKRLLKYKFRTTLND